ncbi:MAG TPA: hypothetical protein VM580_04600 [Labilithrix sp.]|nr:hypothetical protein [Labilithrix sp.]
MRSTAPFAAILGVLLAAAGCSHNAPPPASEPVRSEVSWTPPGEVDFELADAKTARTGRTRRLPLTLPNPNRHEIRHHQIHAAVR